MKRSTFVRKGAATKRQNIPQGTKPSVHNGQLLVSSGSHDFDQILGGGLPIGSLICIQEDINSNYCQTLLRYFVSEGVACKHTNILCAPLTCATENELPNYLPFNYSHYQLTHGDKEDTSSSAAKTTSSGEVDGSAAGLSPLQQEMKKAQSGGELKIAWRYKEFVEQQEQAAKAKKEQYLSNLQQQRAGGAPSSMGSSSASKKTASTGTVLSHEYDLSKPLQTELMAGHKVHVIDFSKMQTASADAYSLVLQQIADVIQKSKALYTAEDNNGSIVRIALQSLGSLIYSGATANSKHLVRFLIALKALLRSSLAVCIFTVPRQLTTGLDHIQHSSDIVIKMDSFTGSRIDVSEYEFKEYSGLFTILKLPRINSLTVNYAPDTLNYAFKMKKRKMYIEKMHMPPEETRQASNPSRPKYREGSVNEVLNMAAPSASQSFSCSTGGASSVPRAPKKNDLDF